MKTTKIITVLALLGLATFTTSCKKSYTCTCTTVVGTTTTTETHGLGEEYPGDAARSCNNYQAQANNTLPGGTTCHL